jgi:hypothetical protein
MGREDKKFVDFLQQDGYMVLCWDEWQGKPARPLIGHTQN